MSSSDDGTDLCRGKKEGLRIKQRSRVKKCLEVPSFPWNKN